MTSVKGFSLIATPCCRSLYSIPQYRSINLSASEYWTDGYKEGSLFNNDGGLRKCKCGEFYLLKDAIKLELDAKPDTPKSVYVEGTDLSQAIENASNLELELIARRLYWRYLNHPYRDLYRKHREVQEAKWEKENPRPNKFKIIILGLFKNIDYKKNQKSKPFTTPPFDPSQVQVKNMLKLLELITEVSDINNEIKGDDIIEVAELYRELGEFEMAKGILDEHYEDNPAIRKKIIYLMIEEANSAPCRFNY